MPKPDAKSIGECLYRERVLRHMTVKEVGEIVGCTSQTIGNYETGKSTPDVDTLWILADLYNLPMDDLVGRTMQEEQVA